MSQTFQQAITTDPDLTPEQKSFWLSCSVYCEVCDDYTAKLIEGVSADIETGRGLEGIDVSTFKCMRCGEVFSE